MPHGRRTMHHMARPNADMAAAWDGTEGDHWTEHVDRYDAACRRYDRHLLEIANLTAQDRVLDIGCGCGISTRDAARTAREVLGIDLSARMLDRARTRSAAEGLTNTRFEQGDAQIFELGAGAFTVAISRFGSMFFADPVAAFRNIARGLQRHGRLALLTWRSLGDNEWVFAIRDALAAGRTLPDRPPGQPGPFGLAEPAAVREILTAAGFDAIELAEVDEPVVLGTNADDAFAFARGLGLARALLDGLDDARRARALADLRERFAAAETPAGVALRGGAWRVTARRAT